MPGELIIPVKFKSRVCVCVCVCVCVLVYERKRGTYIFSQPKTHRYINDLLQKSLVTKHSI